MGKNKILLFDYVCEKILYFQNKRKLICIFHNFLFLYTTDVMAAGIQFFLFFSFFFTFSPKTQISLVIRTQAEMGHTCRGTINLATATITVDDACNFVISNGGAQTYHLKASCEVERQRWITALELAKAKAARMQAESGKNTQTHGEDVKSGQRGKKNICGSCPVNLL